MDVAGVYANQTNRDGFFFQEGTHNLDLLKC